MRHVQLNVLDLEQTIKETETEYVFSVNLKIKKNKYGMKYINDMFEKQLSPVVTLLGKLDRQCKKEGIPQYIENQLEKY